MIRHGRYLLTGLVEVDETYVAIGDKAIPAGAKRRNPNITKTLVVIAVEMLEPKGFGRIRLYSSTQPTCLLKRRSSSTNRKRRSIGK